jgi:hypothetical protein
VLRGGSTQPPLQGAAAANELGLTQQVPIRDVYVTAGRARTFRVGKVMVPVIHVPAWQLSLGRSGAGAAVRALEWLGPSHAGEALVRLKKTLPKEERQVLAAFRGALPFWMGQAITKEFVCVVEVAEDSFLLWITTLERRLSCTQRDWLPMFRERIPDAGYVDYSEVSKWFMVDRKEGSTLFL